MWFEKPRQLFYWKFRKLVVCKNSLRKVAPNKCIMRKRHDLATLTYKCVRELSNRGADEIRLSMRL